MMFCWCSVDLLLVLGVDQLVQLSLQAKCKSDDLTRFILFDAMVWLMSSCQQKSMVTMPIMKRWHKSKLFELFILFYILKVFFFFPCLLHPFLSNLKLQNFLIYVQKLLNHSHFKVDWLAICFQNKWLCLICKINPLVILITEFWLWL